MLKTSSALVVLTLLASCASVDLKVSTEFDSLLSGELLFGEVIDVSDIDAGEVLAIDDEMRGFVQDKVKGYPHARSRLRKLVNGMIKDGLLTLDYDPNLTYSARETFHRRQGNCLSFSNLFVALAREANLDVTFQMVDIPPSFSAGSELMLLNNHINVLVKGVRSDASFLQSYVVDFNTAEYNGNYETKRVSDGYAAALYFSNVAVEALELGDTKKAFRYLKKGIQTYPDIAGLWVNLGAVYSRSGLAESAVDAYVQALRVKPSNKSALVNLSSTLASLGRIEEADYFAGQVDYYRQHNPYYHYYLGQADYRAGDLDQALAHIKRAIQLKNTEHQFHYLRGLVYLRLKD